MTRSSSWRTEAMSRVESRRSYGRIWVLYQRNEQSYAEEQQTDVGARSKRDEG